MPLRIGLTGGIGSGKSTVAALLAGCGAHVVDTDAIARRLTLAGGTAIEPIRAAFGSKFIDTGGALDRARMRDHVFKDPAAKRQLEAILHPLIGLETDEQAAAAPPGTTIVFDVPLLVESFFVESARWRQRVDRVLVVDCSVDTQVRRVVARSGWTEPAVRAVIASQASREQRRAVADAVIVNDGIDLAELQRQVSALWIGWHPVKQSACPAAASHDPAP